MKSLDSTEHKPAQHPAGARILQDPPKHRLIFRLILVLATLVLYNPAPPLHAQRAGNVRQAVEDHERAVELEPTPVGYLLLAQALSIGGEAEAARAAEPQAARMDRDLNDDIATVRQLLAN